MCLGNIYLVELVLLYVGDDVPPFGAAELPQAVIYQFFVDHTFFPRRVNHSVIKIKHAPYNVLHQQCGGYV